MQIFRTIWNGYQSEQQSRAQLDAMDLDWVEKLNQFDHLSSLSFEDREKLQSNMQNSMVKKIGDWASAGGSLLITEQISPAVLLYTYKECLGQAPKNCQKALATLRHFAKLLYSANSFLTQVHVFYLLRKEKEFVHRFSMKDYQTFDQELLNASERVTWAWKSILDGCC